MPTTSPTKLYDNILSNSLLMGRGSAKIALWGLWYRPASHLQFPSCWEEESFPSPKYTGREKSLLSEVVVARLLAIAAAEFIAVFLRLFFSESDGASASSSSPPSSFCMGAFVAVFASLSVLLSIFPPLLPRWFSPFSPLCDTLASSPSFVSTLPFPGLLGPASSLFSPLAMTVVSGATTGTGKSRRTIFVGTRFRMTHFASIIRLSAEQRDGPPLSLLSVTRTTALCFPPLIRSSYCRFRSSDSFQTFPTESFCLPSSSTRFRNGSVVLSVLSFLLSMRRSTTIDE
mmetsp:Transcript_31112/g.73344  ORF Transcript_31112/g.73344 Transcript_31112/m.73344 type:complete len:287 (-) Transcript_31112:87-947(-)